MYCVGSGRSAIRIQYGIRGKNWGTSGLFILDFGSTEAAAQRNNSYCFCGLTLFTSSLTGNMLYSSSPALPVPCACIHTHLLTGCSSKLKTHTVFPGRCVILAFILQGCNVEAFALKPTQALKPLEDFTACNSGWCALLFPDGKPKPSCLCSWTTGWDWANENAGTGLENTRSIHV